MEQDNPITQACQAVGGPSALARLIGVSPAMVYQWCSERRQVPSDWCPAIERATKSVSTCESLRGDLPWSRITDSAWPHPNGRPVLDVALRLSIPSSSAGPASTQPAAAVQTTQRAAEEVQS